MRHTVLFAAAAALAVALGGCSGPKACREGTVLATVTLEGTAREATALQIDVSIDSGAAVSHTIEIAAGSTEGTVEIGFSRSYPAGKTVAVTVRAVASNTVLATGMEVKTIGEGCDTLTVVVGQGGASDGGMGDGMCTPTTTTCPADACGRVDDGCGGFIECATPCQLTSLSPALANTGDTLVLEGLFYGDTTVDFPGAPGQTATLLGPNRVAVSVPATATAGELNVTSGNTTLGPLYFRRAAYPLGWHAFVSGRRIPEPQGDVGRRAGALRDRRQLHTMTHVKGRLVVIGGSTGSNNPLSSVEVGLVNADGTLGLFSTLPISLALPVYGHTTHLIGSSIHVIGGFNGSTIYDVVQRAAVGADGSISDFSVVGGPTLSTARWGHVSAVVGNALYVIGGTTEAGDVATVERAPINPDGTIGSFAAVPGVTLTQPRHGGAVFVTRSAVYVVGGLNGNTELASVEAAPIAADGSLGAFAAQDVALSKPQAVRSAFVVGGAVYTFGATIERAPVNADGSLGAFTSLGDHAETTDGAAAIVRDVFYWSGGWWDGVSNQVFRGSFNASGNLSKFTLDPLRKLADKRARAVTFVSGDYVYMVGGITGTAITDGVQRSRIAPDDSLVGWENVVGVKLTTPRHSAAGVIYEISAGANTTNYLYITGGVSTESPALATIERAPIAADGALGPFEVVNVPMNTPRSGHRALIGAFGPTVVGGATSSAPGTFTPLTSIEFTYGDGNGSLSPWTNQSAMYNLTTARFNFGMVAAGQYFWAMGSNGSNSIERVDKFGFGQFGSGTWSTTALTTTVNQHFNVLTVGPYTYLVGGSTAVGRSRLGDANPASFVVDADSGTQLNRAAAGATLVGNVAYLFGGEVSGSVDSIEWATLK